MPAIFRKWAIGKTHTPVPESRRLPRRLRQALCAIGAAFVVAPFSAQASARTTRTVQSGTTRLVYRLDTGAADITWENGVRIAGLVAEVRLPDRTVSSRDYPRRSWACKGGGAVVTLTGAGLPTMRQRITLRRDHALLSVEVSGAGLSSDHMAPLVADGPGCVALGRAEQPRALRVPYDNDQWARYEAAPLAGAGQSYEVAAFYDNASRRGLVVGSVTHDTWKTGIRYTGATRGDAARLDALRAFGGIADAGTRDVAPHGAVTGDTLVSPTVMVAAVSDWRDGMEAFALENVRRRPMLAGPGGVPFGWNSWGSIQSGLNAEKALAVSDAFAHGWPGGGFQEEPAWINLDSYWDNLSDADLRAFVRRVRANGQRPGIYWGPFVYWGSDLSRPVEGSEATFGDIVLRAPDGTPLRLDGAYALDPTHPATRRRNEATIDRFRALGFRYIKLDFLTHAALEGGLKNGHRHDPSVETGVQAYHRGMRDITRRIGGAMFISASIAPLFPHGYAHARRVSCDSYGAIGETEYAMNSIGYGWWLSGRLYAYNDPDHLVLLGHTPDENMARVTSGAIAGTVFLNGDDVTNPAARRRVGAFFANRAINGLARRGRAFRPVEGNTGDRAPEVMTLQDGAEHYLAVFHYDKAAGAQKRVDLARAGLDPGVEYNVEDLWTGRIQRAQGAITVSLRPAHATILRLTPLSK